MTDKVVIVVRGGVAEVTARSANVQLLILDLDNLQDDGLRVDVESTVARWFGGEPYVSGDDGIEDEYEIMYEDTKENADE